MKLSINVVTKDTLASFRPYILQNAQETMGQKEDAICLGAVLDGTNSCGAIVGVPLGEGVLCIISLFVDEKVRRQGIGFLLLYELLQHTTIDMEVCALWILPEEENRELLPFLEACGFGEAEFFENIYRVQLSTLINRPVLKSAFSPSYKMSQNVIPYEKWSEEDRNSIETDDTIASLLKPSNFDTKVLHSGYSFGYRYNGRMQAYLLLQETGEQRFAVLSAVSRKDGNPAAMLQLATAALHQCLTATRHKSGEIWMEAINEHSEKLIRGLFGADLQIWGSYGSELLCLEDYLVEEETEPSEEKDQ